MSYSSQSSCFVLQNTNYYMFVEKDANSDVGRWFYGTNTDGGANPRGNVPQLTADAIINGTFDGQTGTVSYNNSNYRFRLERDANGNHIAKAYAV